MDSENGRLWALCRDTKVLIQGEGEHELVVNFTDAAFNPQSFSSLLQNPDSRFTLLLKNIQSRRDLPVIHVYLNSDYARNENYEVGQLALYGIGHYTRSGKGINISLDVKEAFMQAIHRENWMEHSFKLLFVSKRSRKQLSDFEIELIELRGY